MTGEMDVSGGAVYDHVCGAIDPAGNVSGEPVTLPAPVQLISSVTPVSNGAIDGLYVNGWLHSLTANEGGAGNGAVNPD